MSDYAGSKYVAVCLRSTECELKSVALLVREMHSASSRAIVFVVLSICTIIDWLTLK